MRGSDVVLFPISVTKTPVVPLELCQQSSGAPHLIKPGDMLYLPYKLCFFMPNKISKNKTGNNGNNPCFPFQCFFVSWISSSPNVNNKERVGKIGFSNKKKIQVSSWKPRKRSWHVSCICLLSRTSWVLAIGFNCHCDFLSNNVCYRCAWWKVYHQQLDVFGLGWMSWSLSSHAIHAMCPSPFGWCKYCRCNQ